MSTVTGALRRNVCLGAVLSILGAAVVHSQPSLYEVEPNNTPAEATEIAGEVVLIGTMEGQDQDGYKWVVSDVDAQRRWTFELQGIPGKLTVVEVVRIDYAENGVDVAGTERLFKMGTRDGSKPSIHEDLLFEPGEYILGVAHSGGGDAYRPPVDSITFEDQGTNKSPGGSERNGYRLTIREGSPIYLESQPKDRSTADVAYKLRLDSENASYLETPDTWYLIEITDKQADQKWDVDGQVPVGRQVQATLQSGDGSPLAKTTSDSMGEFSFPDLGLEAGLYKIEIKGKDTGYVRSVLAHSVGHRIEGAEAEPNDNWQLANRADLSQPISGRMGTRGESDYFLFSLDEPTTDAVLAVRLETGTDHEFELCLLDGRGTRLQCRTAKGTIDLPDLVLQPGDWGLVVGRGPEAAEYSLTLSTQGTITAGVEAEPNDKIENAAAIPSNNRIKGRFSGDDTDFFTILVTEEPQLWRFQVIGDEVHELAYHDASGIQSQRYRIPKGQRRVRLENLFLLPGVHHVRVTGRHGGTYTLLARPIGPPDPNGELEPNDDTSRMQPLRIGQTRTGLLEDVADRDNYRFYLGHWDRVRLTLEPPPDGTIRANLYWDGTQFKEYNNPQTAEKIVLEGLLPPGDYRLELAAKKTSEAEYKLKLERLERFGCPTDCEPNDNIAFANPVPATRVVEGRVNEWRDPDWYSLPILEQSTVLTVTMENRRNIEVVEVASGDSLVKWDNDQQAYRGTIPAGVQTYLHIQAWGEPPYRFELGFAGRPDAIPEPPPLPIELTLNLEADEVSAYRQYGQVVDGNITLTNKGSAPLNLDLNAATSDYRWRAQLEETRVAVPAGGSQTVPATVYVPADAWADWPVRISARARASNGGQVESFRSLAVDRDTTPVQPVRAWTLPEELLGGFNVAWDALGGRWAGQENTAIGHGFAELFDGIAVKSKGMQLRGGYKGDLAEVTVELAGDQPVEVTGLVLNLLAFGSTQHFLRNIDFSLSLDGQEFSQVYEGELLPIKAEQAFALEHPTRARFARLRFQETFDGKPHSQATLGELKVIAKPGTDITAGMGFNLADPTLGGHVVWSQPQITHSNWDSNMLEESGQFDQRRLAAGQGLEWVVGFHHDRAAQITRLEWTDSSEMPTDRRIGKVSLAVSLDSPVGPWIPIGDWDLPESGTSARLDLKEPTWARFVKFSVNAPSQQVSYALPEVLRIWERPTEGDYRSVLTEWGFASQAAIYEALRGVEVEEPFRAAGNDSKAKAAPLAAARPATGQVVLGKHEHWYKVTLPAGENTLTLELGGDPTVRTAVTAETSSGEPLPIRMVSGTSLPSSHVFEVVATPGSTIFLRIEEPPRNVVFLWDTSASIGAYLPIIYNSLIAYSEDVVPGRDAANLMPFGGNLLLRDWYGEPYILQTVLNDYPRKESSSEAEETLAKASKALSPRAGTKAIVMVTDAATNRGAAVWEEFREVQPRVFGLGVSSEGALGRQPRQEQDLMQDWSRVNGGHYAHLLNEGEMEIAFDRAATMLRRPANYTLAVTTSFKKAPGPGTLRVVGQSGSGATGGAVELILDASGSMLQRLDGKRRIVVAKEVLTAAVNEHIPSGTPVALRVFGHKEPNACRTDLVISLQPLDSAAASNAIQAINAMNLAKTPIADSLAKVESDLKSAKGRQVVVLVTDGEETCDGKPEEVIQELQDKGFDIALNIVGFAIDDEALEAQFETWAKLGGGRYFSAKNQEGLSRSLGEALRAPFSVYDIGGTLVAEGVVGGDSIDLEQGTYRVVVQTSPQRTFDRVEIPGEKDVVLEAGDPGS